MAHGAKPHLTLSLDLDDVWYLLGEFPTYLTEINVLSRGAKSCSALPLDLDDIPAGWLPTLDNREKCNGT
jgi:hypothetical protein